MNPTTQIYKSFLHVLCLGVFFVPPVAGQEQAKESTNAISQIKKVMQDLEARWTKGDIEGFMKGYWKSEKLTFSSGGKTKRGWQATLDSYKNSFPAGKMGKLKFDNLEFSILAPKAALVLGQWHLDIDGEKKDGNFSLVFQNMEDKWVIIHDHSSSLKKKPEKETKKMNKQ